MFLIPKVTVTAKGTVSSSGLGSNRNSYTTASGNLCVGNCMAQALSVTIVWTCRCWPLGTTILYQSWHSFRTLMTLLPFLMVHKQKQLQQFGDCCLWHALDFAVRRLLLEQWSSQVVLPDCEQLCPMLRWVSACFLKALCNFLSTSTKCNTSTTFTLKCL